jgi:hypothetical protein
VVLVRHSISAVDPATSPHTWGLTDEGRRLARDLDGAAICSGGRAIAAVVAHHAGIDGLALWKTLSMPDVIVLYQDESGRWVAFPR